MIPAHSLPEDAFLELAGGAGDGVAVKQLREAQLSKHLMLLHAVAQAAEGADSPSPAASALRAGYRVLARAEAADPGAVARVLCLPHVGSWAHDALASLDGGSVPDFGYLAAVAAAAAVRQGICFELDVPAPDGGVLLPGLGVLQVAACRDEWVRLSSDGERLRAGEHIDVPCVALVPDDGSGSTSPHWRGTPLLRAVADGHALEVLLETADPYLDRFSPGMLTGITEVEVTSWRQRIQAAWELLVRHHGWAAGPIAEGVAVIVPLVPVSDQDSATSPAAFGAIASSLPVSPVIMAETLVHEFQHIKLCGLLDMLPLIEPNDELGYAPWRNDPRPMGGILQGVYAFAGIVRFWDIQRRVEMQPDAILRASVLYERWRLELDPVTATLLRHGSFTPNGARFVTILSEHLPREKYEPVPPEAVKIAQEVALDHRLTWQLMHMALDAAEVAGLAAAYQRGEPRRGRVLPEARIEADVRKFDSLPRTRLLNMRFRDPRRYQRLSAADVPELIHADVLLVCGDPKAAVTAYRAALATQPDPAAWVGLALAIHRLPAMQSQPVFATHLPLLFEMHACLLSRGVHADPLELAAWFQ